MQHPLLDGAPVGVVGGGARLQPGGRFRACTLLRRTALTGGQLRDL